MKTLLYTFLVIAFTQSALPQSDPSKTTSWKVDQKSIFYVNEKEVSELFFYHLNPNNIESINVIKGDKAIAVYGDKGKNGVLLAKTKNYSKKELRNLETLYALEYKSNRNNKEVSLSGVIKDCDVVLSFVEIEILNSKEKITSAEDGSFKISCHKNDVIAFRFPDAIEQRIVAIKNNNKLEIKLQQKPQKNPSESIIYKKPVIYLYPEKQTDISLKFNFNGKVLTTFPKYDDGWEVTSYPDGKIFDKKTKRFYNSLFWDGQRNFDHNDLQYQEGFMVERKQLTSFLIEKLEIIGLNNNETNDFVQYWLPILEQNEFNFIHFKTNDEYNKISKNIIHPKPETSIRIMMEFYKINTPYSVIEQKLTRTKRKGFTLVEWGGAEIPENLLKKIFRIYDSLKENQVLTY